MRKSHGRTWNTERNPEKRAIEKKHTLGPSIWRET